MSYHGLSPKERGLPPVHYPSIVSKPITASAARRARASSSRVSPPPERQPAQRRLRACHANAGCVLEAIACTSHHRLPRKERGLPPVCCPSITRRQIALNATQRARTQHALVFCHLPINSQRSGARASVTRKPAACWRSQLARRTTVLRRKREAFCQYGTLRQCADRSQPAQHSARTQQACVFCHLPRDIQRSGACARSTRLPAARWRP